MTEKETKRAKQIVAFYLTTRKMREKENKKLQKYFYQVSAPLIPTKD
jgi:hypothetical protein